VTSNAPDLPLHELAPLGRSYGFILWLALAFLAGGPSIGGSLQPTRLLFLGLFLTLLVQGRFVVGGTSIIDKTYLLAALWIGWGVLSWAWTPDPFAGGAEVIIESLGFVIIITLISVVRQSAGAIEVIRYGWVSAFLMTLPFAIWELATNHHLGSNVVDVQTGGEFSLPFFYASVTFGNRNDYATFLVLCFPFLLWSLARSRPFILKVLLTVLLVSAGFIVAVNGSRLGMGALIIELAVWISWQLSHAHSGVGAILVVVAVAAAGNAAFRFQPASLQRVEGLAAGLSGSSTIARLNIVLNGLELVKRSGGVGVGAGGFEHEMVYAPRMKSAGGIVNPHNVWIEIASQYGLVVFFAFVSWLFYLAITLLRAARLARRQRLPAIWAIAPQHALLVLAGLLPAAAMSSSLLQWTMLWTSLACVAAIADSAQTRVVAPRPFGRTSA
jgi:teichuronic acid biosynthesis protein TuaE